MAGKKDFFLGIKPFPRSTGFKVTGFLTSKCPKKVQFTCTFSGDYYSIFRADLHPKWSHFTNSEIEVIISANLRNLQIGHN